MTATTTDTAKVEPNMTTLTLHLNRPGPTVNPNIYGHFAEHLGRCIYEGFWVGEDSEIPNTRGIRNDVVAALRNLNLPVLRWPGGCFADEYHWMDGIGPRDQRPSMINTHWGGVVENNHFGTHEFFDLCEQLGTEPYICGNVGSGTVREMSEWVEYMTSDADSPMANLRRKNGRKEPWRLKYFGVGNESWGCGGNMRPEFYADLYRQYNTYVRTYGDKKIERIACGSNTADLRWTEVLMERAKHQMHGLSYHNYTLVGGWPPKGKATGFSASDWFAVMAAALRVGELVGEHVAIMDQHDAENKVGMVMDEWGTWFAVEEGTNPGFLYQQNSLRDAVVAAIHFNFFHEYAKRITMCNIAQTVNVLQAMILTEGPRMLCTPTYWAFEMYKDHQGAAVISVEFASPRLVHEEIEVPALTITATRKGNQVTVSVANLDPSETHELDIPKFGEFVSGRVLGGTAMDAHNTFDAPDTVRPQPLEPTDSGTFQIPQHSVVTLTWTV